MARPVKPGTGPIHLARRTGRALHDVDQPVKARWTLVPATVTCQACLALMDGPADAR